MASALRSAFDELLSQGEFAFEDTPQETARRSLVPQRGEICNGGSLAVQEDTCSPRLFAEDEGAGWPDEVRDRGRQRSPRRLQPASPFPPAQAPCRDTRRASGVRTPNAEANEARGAASRKRERLHEMSASSSRDEFEEDVDGGRAPRGEQRRRPLEKAEGRATEGRTSSIGVSSPADRGAFLRGRRHSSQREWGEATQRTGSGDDRENEEEGDRGQDDVLRILVATDTHLGYKADDSERGGDSFETFQEILEIGRNLKVDFLLHGGDLFDENRPSRATLYRTFCLLRKFCFGDGAVSFEVLEGAAESRGRGEQSPRDSERELGEKRGKKVDGFRFGLNYLDENINVCMPIFAMHGNHDDPGEQSHLSPLDLLEAAHLINYFGRCDATDEVTIKPILIKKGQTKVAIYGVGWIRDARLHRAFNNGKVRFLVPSASAGEDSVDDWFNIMVVHQNMYKGAFGGQPAKNCIHEQMLPDFLDLAIWGHEHDCHLDLRDAPQGTFRVLQPGSSIATSLVAGEALPKHVFLLEIRGENYRVTPQRLRTVRPLLFEDVALSDLLHSRPPLAPALSGVRTPQSRVSNSGAGRNLQTAQPAEDRDVWQLLTDAVEELLSRFARENPESEQDGEQGEASVGGGARQRKGGRSNGGESRETKAEEEEEAFELFCNYSTKEKKKLPLVRLRVEHSGFSTISTSRFGAQFVGRVANPGDLLHFYRKRASANHAPGEKPSQRLPDLEIEEIAGNETSEIRDIIFHFLEETNTLDLLPEPDFNVAVQDFVVKMDTNAIAAFIDRNVQAARREAKMKLRDVAPDASKDVEPADVHALIVERTRSIREKRILHGFPDDEELLERESSAQNQEPRQRSTRQAGEAAREEEDDFAADTLDTRHLPERNARRHDGETGFSDDHEWQARETDSDFSDEAGIASRGGRGSGSQRTRRGLSTRGEQTRGGKGLSLAASHPREETSVEASCPQRGRRGRGRGHNAENPRRVRAGKAQSRGDSEDDRGAPGVRRKGRVSGSGFREEQEDRNGEADGNQSLARSSRSILRGSSDREKPMSQLSVKRKGAFGGLSSEPKRQQADLRAFFRHSQVVSSPASAQPRGPHANSGGGTSLSRVHATASEGGGNEEETPNPRVVSSRPGAETALSHGVGACRELASVFPEREGREMERGDGNRTAMAGGYSVGTQEFTRKRRSSVVSEEECRRKEEESMMDDEEEDDVILSSLGRAADSAFRRGADCISSSWSRRR
ncbi:Mre11 DNA-binding domain-containing protein [Toxoplasma gondii MAS]|uniref:Mre11 DNA-binding domain-containing protein n=2 Tax=Toxoplasma gondii TaxID=5811 RepID=A0A086QIX2_TOXGO|nr:Mre11 DNA-binding domain-containing protein [Toxoplasma gondii MAS]PUA85167.1 Mre11 DNA-binding domain-containing protein [Toxoplasma gondii TgCATBr9]